jgi:precorrin-6A/cobalt-precorrin-6A reductase
MRKRILILGGTTEARECGELLAHRSDFDVTLSLAGRTASPAAQPVPVRRGGFGGIVGLVSYLREHQIDAVIDATHPFAATMSAHAWSAAVQTDTPLIAIRRPAWSPEAGDRWTEVHDAKEAVRALAPAAQNVFLALGRQEIAEFAHAPQHRYLIRSVDAVDPPLDVPYARYILARGPFEEDEERKLLVANTIDVLVAKNSGGAAAYGKIVAARKLGISVILFRRPPELPVPNVSTATETVAWLDHVLGPAADERGV